MTFSAFSVAIILIFANAVTIGIYRGRQRGFFKSLIFLGSALFSVTVSIILSPAISNLISTAVFDNVLPGIKEYRSFVSAYSSLDDTLQAVATALISTLLFVLIFFIVRGIAYFLFIRFGARAFKNRSDDPG